MTDSTSDLLNRALSLPLADRAVLAAEIAASLDEDEDPEAVANAWLPEIERRVRRAVSGQSELSDWNSVRGRIEERLSQRS